MQNFDVGPLFWDKRCP